MRNTIILLLVLLSATTIAQETQPALELSLEEAMRLAVRNNPQAKNARLDILNQEAINSEVTGRALPNISGKGEFNQYPDPVKSFLPSEFFTNPQTGQPQYPPGTFVPVQFTPKYSTTASVSGNQILFDGSIFVALQARNTLVELYKTSSRLTDEEIRYNIEKAYNAIVIAQKQSEILNESIDYARSIGNDLRVLYENGFTEKIEVDRVTVQVNNLATDSIRINNMLEVSKQLLKYQMGLDNDMPIVLTDTSLEYNVEESKSLLLEDVRFSNRTDYTLLNTQLKLNEYDLKRYRFAAMPSLAAFGTAAYTYQTNDFKALFEEQYVFYSLIGLQLNVPIFDGLQRRNKVKQAKISIEKTKNELENLKLGIRFQEEQATTQLNNALLTMRSQERNLELARSVLELARKKYKAGVGSNMEVSQAQTEMLQAQNNYFQSMLDVVNAEADLKKALGEY